MENKLQNALWVMRLSGGVFLLVWAFQKVLAPEMSVRIWTGFYGVPLPETVLFAMGFAHIAFIFAFMAGAFKTVTYGGVLLFHAISVISTWERLMEPYSSPNGLFWAGVPVIALFWALFLLRAYDQKFVVSRRR